jgi:hypothetical protein
MPSVAVIRELMSAGLEGEALLTALQRIEDAEAPVLTSRQERNARYYDANKEALRARARDRKARLKPSETAETASETVLNRLKPSETDGNEPPPPSVTQPLSDLLSSTGSPLPVLPKRTYGPKKVSGPPRFAAEHFDEFWAAFPNKVGKGEARKSFERIRLAGIVSWDDLLAGLERYRAKTDDRPWCNPTTWLNQERWSDSPNEMATGQRRANPAHNGRWSSVTEGRSRVARMLLEERDELARLGDNTFGDFFGGASGDRRQDAPDPGAGGADGEGWPGKTLDDIVYTRTGS